MTADAITFIRDAAKGLVDLVWPPQCCVCRRMDDSFFCQTCQDEIQHIEPPVCVICGLPGVRSSCPDCGEAPWLSSGFSCDCMRQVAVYEGKLVEAIHAFKFDGMRCLAHDLTKLLTDWLEMANHVWREVDAVSYVPGHRLRGWELGFHHAEVLAKGVSDFLNRPLVQVVWRKAGPSQVAVQGRAERMNNARRVYSLKTDHTRLTAQTILLIDDIVTTGATAEVVGGLLKSAGASKVRSLALARKV